MFKVFVSYSTLDLQNVTELQRTLVGTGVKVFVAEHSVLPSQALAPTISRAIAACDLFVLIWSKNAKASEWVSQEIGQAHSLQKRVLPLVLTEGMALPGFISGLKYVPVFKDPAKGIVSARNVMLRLLKAKQAALFAQRAVQQRKKQKEKENMALLGVGAFFLWAVSQK